MNNKGLGAGISFAPFLTNARYSLTIALSPFPMHHRLIVNTY